MPLQPKSNARRGLHSRPLLKREIENAQKATRSAAHAARYLNVSYKTYKKYATMYGIFTKNQSGVGIPRPKKRGAYSLQAILEGQHPFYDHNKLKERILRAGIFANECGMCGYSKARADGRVPLVLYLLDGNKNNLKQDNLQLRCYNCTFLTSGYIDPKLLTISPHTFNQDIDERMKAENITMEELYKDNEALLKDLENENS